MIPKTEQNVIVNVPASKPSLSFKKVVKDFQKSLKDLQHLEKSCVMKQEIEALKAKMKELEKENGTLKVDLQSLQALKQENFKLKADLVAKEENRLLYNNAFDKKVKEMTELNAENESLKAKIISLGGSNEALIEEIEQEHRPLQEQSSSSIQSAFPVNDSSTEEEEASEEISETAPLLAICDNRHSTRANVAPLKRSSPSTSVSLTPSSKKAKYTATPTDTHKPWKCIICKSRYDTIEELRSHIRMDHPSRKYFCARCPFTTANTGQLKKHEGQHRDNELKCSDSGKTNKCERCNICYFQIFALTAHIKNYH